MTSGHCYRTALGTSSRVPVMPGQAPHKQQMLRGIIPNLLYSFLVRGLLRVPGDSEKETRNVLSFREGHDSKRGRRAFAFGSLARTIGSSGWPSVVGERQGRGPRAPELLAGP